MTCYSQHSHASQVKPRADKKIYRAHSMLGARHTLVLDSISILLSAGAQLPISQSIHSCARICCLKTIFLIISHLRCTIYLVKKLRLKAKKIALISLEYFLFRMCTDNFIWITFYWKCASWPPAFYQPTSCNRDVCSPRTQIYTYEFVQSFHVRLYRNLFYSFLCNIRINRSSSSPT